MNTTLLHIKEILSFYAKKNDNIQKVNDDELIAMMMKLLNQFPYLLHPICDSNLSKKQAFNLVNNIKKSVSENYVPVFPSYSKFVDVIGNYVIETPVFVSYNDCQTYIESKNLNDYLLNILLSMPINKVNITFLELGEEYVGDFFYKNINSKIYHNNPITDEYEFQKYLNVQKKRIVNVREQYGDYIEYCLNNKRIPISYEFLIISENHTSWFSDYEKELELLSEQSWNSGFYIIRVSKQETETDFSALTSNLERTCLCTLMSDPSNNPYTFHELRFSNNHSPYDVKQSLVLFAEKYHYRYKGKVCPINPTAIDINKKSNITFLIKDFDETLHYALKLDLSLQYKITKIQINNQVKEDKLIIRCIPLTQKTYFLQACIDYINNEADSEEREFMKKHYIQDFESIVVPVGINSSNMVVNFSMDLTSHVHSFIIGQSGSGKSVFLHNVISSVIYKYAPEDIQLYLLDFKLGGVEFNRYKGVKHVKSLLVDNSDQQITLEILRELRDSMIERGRKLRGAGVNNLVEYNKKNPSATMPQILLVVDECHEMFRVGSDIPRTVSNEISEIVTKIAKEGRSQGVHLIMATQTLSGTEISNEILNNISDHYLLKCASVDSERMVERSTDITSKLSTGHIYYHHVDSQVTFQGYYIDKENAELQIQKIKDKAKNHASNGEFYFNGSQLFQLNKNILESGKNQKYPTAYIGKNISIKQNDLSITLKKDFSENILLFGLNEQEQVTRTTMNVFLSLLYNTKCKGIDMDFKVFNCLSNDESIYTEQLEMLESKGLCEIIEGKKDRGCFLKQLAEDVINGTSNNTILLILGQERFRELKMDLDISDDKEQSSNEAFGFGEFNFGSSSSSSSVNTFRKALESILDKGPETGVHVIMQLDKPSNFLFSDYISSKLVYQKFKHLIMLKSDEAASSQLGLNDNVRLENLSRDLERLRAYYYAEESDTYTLFTPYMESSKEEIVELLNL